jgi:hypothetical protein
MGKLFCPGRFQRPEVALEMHRIGRDVVHRARGEGFLRMLPTV